MTGNNKGGGVDRLRKVLTQQQQQEAIAAAMMQRATDMCHGATASSVAFLGARTNWRPSDRLAAVKHALRLVIVNDDALKAGLGVKPGDPSGVPVLAIHGHCIATCQAALDAAGDNNEHPREHCVALAKSLVDAAFMLLAGGAPEPPIAMQVIYGVAADNAQGLSDERIAAIAAQLGDRGAAFAQEAKASRESFGAIAAAFEHGINTLDGVVQAAMPKVQLVRSAPQIQR